MKKKYKEEVPYDYFNPAVSTETLKKRMCVKCNLIIGAINMKDTNHKWCTKKLRRRDQDITQVIEQLNKESEASTSIEATSSARPIRPARIKHEEDWSVSVLSKINSTGMMLMKSIRMD